MSASAIELPQSDRVLGKARIDLAIADLSDLPVIRVESYIRELTKMIEIAAP